MFDEKEIRVAARTIMSMCTDFLMGGLKENDFRIILLAFAESANPTSTKSKVEKLKSDSNGKNAIDQSSNVFEKLPDIVRVISHIRKHHVEPDEDYIVAIVSEVYKFIDRQQPCIKS